MEWLMAGADLESAMVAMFQGEQAMAKNSIFIEPRANGGFGAKHAGGQRSVITGDTQRQVIQDAKAKYPEATVHVARVRDVGPGPDKYRKA